MSISVQNYIVYFIVIVAFIKFTQPFWEFIFKLLSPKKHIVPEDTSCYTGTCSKCKVKS